MPGLVGFSQAFEGAEPVRVLQDMQDLITHNSSYARDELFCDGIVCGTRSHTNIIQMKPQPFQKDGIYIWLDGEFYNRSELSQYGKFTAHTDLELLWQLYKLNPELSPLEQIDGIYAAVIYNSVEQKVHLLSDRYGLRHLYWVTCQGSLVWSSEAKALLAFPSFAPVIDQQALKNFFEIGYLRGDGTWFEGVELLPSGTIQTWDIRKGTLSRKRYWWWDNIVQQSGKINLEETTEELGRLFLNAVQRRMHGRRLGLMLSGGLDSRAILAAMQEQDYPISAITFGRPGSIDIKIASAVVKVKGAAHHIVEMNERNWLLPRIAGVWWTDGQLDLLHMHSIGTLPTAGSVMDITLSGFLGDATVGGSYIEHKGSNEIDLIDNRGRRFIILGPKTTQAYIHARLPFFDNDFLSFALSIPAELRKRSYIYNLMLLKLFPEYFNAIPWQKTGVPISWPETIVVLNLLVRQLHARLSRISNRFGLRSSQPFTFTDYPNWLRCEPARSFISNMLGSSKAIFPEFIPQQKVINKWQRHLRGDDNSMDICRYLTFEIWLQQVYEKKYRGGGNTL